MAVLVVLDSRGEKIFGGDGCLCVLDLQLFMRTAELMAIGGRCVFAFVRQVRTEPKRTARSDGAGFEVAKIIPSLNILLS